MVLNEIYVDLISIIPNPCRNTWHGACGDVGFSDVGISSSMAPKDLAPRNQHVDACAIHLQ